MSQIARAEAVFPAGVSNGEFGFPDDRVVIMERGQGCKLWDTDGKEYLDFSMGWGSCLVGHARPEVVDAVRRQAELGSNFSYLNTHVMVLAEEIQRISPAARRMRFCSSGTEATMYCQRLARAFSGKTKILKFEGAYHGANEIGVTSLFPQKLLNFPTPDPTSAGIDAIVRDTVLVGPWNDLEAVCSIITEHKGDLAAVIAEPLQRCTPPKPGFLEGLRKACDDNGVLLIFDEVVTGFRLAYGGAQEYYGVVPDLVAYGKALGGGYPIGAFGGREDIMEMVSEHRAGGEDYVWMAASLGGNPISCSAANAALSVYRKEGTYEHLHGLGDYMRQGMRKVLEGRGITAQIIGDGPLAQVAFSENPVHDYRTTKAADSAKGRAMMMAIFDRGVFLNPMGTKLYLSLAHDEAVCDQFFDRFDAALAEISE